MPRLLVGLLIGLGAIASLGCVHDGDWSFRRAIGWEKVQTPPPPKFPAASQQAAQRVETLGKRIMELNTFPGLEPQFFTMGVPQPALFHRGDKDLFISEGVVQQCKSEGELAAVLCSELGKMKVEQDGASRVGREPPVAPPGAADTGFGAGADMTWQADVARFEQRNPGASPARAGRAVVDPRTAARTLLTGAGFDAAELDRVRPLVTQANKGAEPFRKPMAGNAPAPTWDQ